MLAAARSRPLRSRPLRRRWPGALVAGLIFVLGASGCQGIAFGVANLGVPKSPRTAEASVLYDAAHGLSLDVYRPESASTRAVPVVVFLYGGSWRNGRREQYRFVGRRLAQQGVLAIVADYRTAPQTVFPGFVEDAARSVAWAKRHAADHGGNPARVYLAGHSAGAHIAALVGTDARYLAAHGLKPRDLAGVIGLSGPYDFEIAGYEDVFGSPAQWPQTQPLAFVDGDEPPFLLVHGTGDTVVEPVDSRILAERLRAAGGSAEVLWLPDAGHLAPLAAMHAPGRQPTLLPAIRAFVGNADED